MSSLRFQCPLILPKKITLIFYSFSMVNNNSDMLNKYQPFARDFWYYFINKWQILLKVLHLPHLNLPVTWDNREYKNLISGQDKNET